MHLLFSICNRLREQLRLLRSKTHKGRYMKKMSILFLTLGLMFSLRAMYEDESVDPSNQSMLYRVQLLKEKISRSYDGVGSKERLPRKVRKEYQELLDDLDKLESLVSFLKRESATISKEEIKQKKIEYNDLFKVSSRPYEEMMLHTSYYDCRSLNDEQMSILENCFKPIRECRELSRTALKMLSDVSDKDKVSVKV